MSVADDITNATLPDGEKANAKANSSGRARGQKWLAGSNPAPATKEVAAILKAADLAVEPMDLRYGGPGSLDPTPAAELVMPAYVYRAKRRKLTRIVMEEICDAIRGGAMDYIAAQAAGLTQEQFDHFMRTFKVFRLNVEQAHAQCRVQLEQAVARKKPLEWLLKGPGRHKPGREGWTAQTAITGADGGNVQHQVTHKVDLSRLTEAELLKMRELVAKTEEKGEVIEAEFKEVDETEKP